MMKRILVPLDGSELAEHAIPVAARIARASLGSILFLRVVNMASEFGTYMTEPSPFLQETFEEDIVSATRYLARITMSKELAGIATDVGVFTGAAALQIIDVARTQHTDLIVMCSHGATGIRRWIMGSVAHKVIRHSPIPTLVLRSGASLPQEGTHPIRVLVTLDGSTLAETVLEPVMQLITSLAPPTQVALHLLRVINIPDRYIGIGLRSQVQNDVAAIEEQVRGEAETYLHIVADRLRTNIKDSSTLSITSSVKVNADVAGTIVKVAEQGDESGYDMIAMATHGRGGVTRWAMGSITERVLDGTKLPLLVVRAPKVHHPPMHV